MENPFPSGRGLTIYLLQGDLSEDVEVGPVQRPAEHPVDARVIRVQQGLGGHAVRYHPHAQEKEEEENILHLGRHREEREMGSQAEGVWFCLGL